MLGIGVIPLRILAVCAALLAAAIGGDLLHARDDEAPGKVEAHVVEAAGIAEAICDAAETFGADLIVMGTHGRTGLAHVFLGSAAERTLRQAPCPVLTVRAPAEEEQEDA